MTRRERWASLLDELNVDAGCSLPGPDDDLERFVFIQENTEGLDASHWIYFEETIEDAADSASTHEDDGSGYHASRLVDLDTGDEFCPVFTVKWKKQ